MQAKQPHSKHETLTERTIYFKKTGKDKNTKTRYQKGKETRAYF